MVNSALADSLENISVMIRNFLEIPEDYLINYECLDEIIEKINNRFDVFKTKIEHDRGMSFTIKEGNFITITYDKKEEIQKNFEFVLKSFCYGILFDKEILDSYQLQEHNVWENVILNDKSTDYLFKAFLLPEKQFSKELVKYTTGDSSRCDIKAMTKEIGHKHVYSRGIHLGFWH